MMTIFRNVVRARTPLGPLLGLSIVLLALATTITTAVALRKRGDQIDIATATHQAAVIIGGRPAALPTGDGFAIGTNVLDDLSGSLRLSAAEPKIYLFEPAYSNPVSTFGGIVPGSDTNPLLVNFGTFQGQGVTNFKFPVGLNGQTAPLYTLDILSDEPGVTNTDYKIKIGWAGSASFATGAACALPPCEGGGVYSQANLTHASGTAPLIAAGLHGRASIGGAGLLPADRAYSIWGEDGLVRLDGPTTIGLPASRVLMTVNTDASVFQGTTTTAQATATGTLLDLRQGAAHNYLGFSNPDATDGGLVFNNVSNSGDGYLVYKNSNGLTFGTQNATRATLGAAGWSLSVDQFMQGRVIRTVGHAAGVTCNGAGGVSVNGNELAGKVITNTAATSCTVTFAGGYDNDPACTCTSEAAIATPLTCVPTTTGIVINFPALTSAKINYVCVGLQ